MNNYAEQERAKWWPVPAELMAQYNDGSHTDKDSFDSLEWYQDSLRHRDGDLPAIIYANGSLLWYQNDKRHRDGDRPAWISADGTLVWWQNDEIHRTRGPAIIDPDGTLEWWINDEDITQEVNEWLAGEEWQGTPEQIVEFQLTFS